MQKISNVVWILACDLMYKPADLKTLAKTVENTSRPRRLIQAY
jgi:hypothetical protein